MWKCLRIIAQTRRGGTDFKPEERSKEYLQSIELV
jgi:hypothetical protein